MNIFTEEEGRKQKDEHIQMALSRCGYLDWSISLNHVIDWDQARVLVVVVVVVVVW